MSDNTKESINITQSDYQGNLNFCLTFLFWLRIFMGILSGSLYYYVQRVFFHIGFFNVHYIFRGFLIIGVLLIYLFLIYTLITFIMHLVKKRKRVVLIETNIWRFSLRFSVIHFVVFLISAGIMLYIGI
jgi:hypothetical protein